MTLPAPKPGLSRPLNGGGIVCIVLGIIIAMPSGLCAATLIGLAGYSLTEGEAFLAFLVDSFPMLVASVVPLGLGILLIWTGLKMRKGSP